MPIRVVLSQRQGGCGSVGRSLWFNEILTPEETEFIYDSFEGSSQGAPSQRDGLQRGCRPGTDARCDPGAPEFTLVSPHSGRHMTIDGGVSAIRARTLLRLKVAVPPELCNRFGSKIIAQAAIVLRSPSLLPLQAHKSLLCRCAREKRLARRMAKPRIVPPKP